MNGPERIVSEGDEGRNVGLPPLPARGKRFLVVGAGWAGITVAGEIFKKKGFQVAGFLDDAADQGSVTVRHEGIDAVLPVLGPTSKLSETAFRERVDGVVIAVTGARSDELLAQIVRCHQARIPVHEMPELYEKLARKVAVQHAEHLWVVPGLTAPKDNFYSLYAGIMNFAFAALLFLFAFVPLFPLVALAIKWDTPGPVFFRQWRSGLKGKPFVLFKFRTMRADAHAGKAWTVKGDSRITRVGRFLRKFRLDELPQIWNVLRGEMAVIGPRPEAVELVEKFRELIPFYDYRYLVLPGITGWAQVNYGNTCSVRGALEKLQYDLYWIKHRSVGLDLKILAKSVGVVLTGFGSV